MSVAEAMDFQCSLSFHIHLSSRDVIIHVLVPIIACDSSLGVKF